MVAHDMNVWGWIVLYVVLFSVLQLLIYRYLRSDDDAPLLRSTPPGADQSVSDDVRNDYVLDELAEDEPTTDASDSTDVRHCPHCGTTNGSGYTYCRECIEPLGVW